ncbi:MAG: hypothetical protein AAFP77_09275 [Bacteroidota bacterium]
MRFLPVIFICLLWFCASAQSAEVAPTVKTKNKRWRIGAILHSDNSSPNPYLGTGSLILPRTERKNSLVLASDFQVFRAMPVIFITTELGHYRVRAGNDNLNWLDANNWTGAPFVESVQMKYTHFAIGIRAEPFGRHRFSPYLSYLMQYAFPRDIAYDYQSFTSPTFGPLDMVQINGGGKISQGWKVNAGLRARLHPRWFASIGFYHVFMDFLADWPVLNQRRFVQRTYMRLDGGGVELRCQFAI